MRGLVPLALLALALPGATLAQEPAPPAQPAAEQAEPRRAAHTAPADLLPTPAGTDPQLLALVERQQDMLRWVEVRDGLERRQRWARNTSYVATTVGLVSAAMLGTAVFPGSGTTDAGTGRGVPVETRDRVVAGVFGGVGLAVCIPLTLHTRRTWRSAAAAYDATDDFDTWRVQGRR